MRSIYGRYNYDIGRVLVVGGTGRLGGLLRRAWIRSGQTGLVWQTRGSETWADFQFDPLTDLNAYRDAAAGVTTILNLAGTVTGDDAALDLNTTLAMAAIDAARSAGAKVVALASSSAVYGDTGDRADEDSPPRPVSGYGLAKLKMEKAAMAAVRESGSNRPSVVCLRIGNVAGADMLLGGNTSSACTVLDIFADGTGPRRSYIGPSALAEMLARTLAVAKTGRPLPDALNIGLEGSVTMDALLNVSGRDWSPRPAPSGLLRNVVLDVRRLEQVIGVSPGQSDASTIVADYRDLIGELQ
jgi:nucleoside-diphosphate-sugar epimerase